MKIHIVKLQLKDTEDLLQFELEKRAFFEEMVPSRGDDYYNPDNFKISLEALLEEQIKGKSYFYLIKDTNHSIVGRINLTDIDEATKVANLGYIVGQKYTDKGITNQALSLLLQTITFAVMKYERAISWRCFIN